MNIKGDHVTGASSSDQDLSIGDQVRLSGGYDMEPAWLCGRSAYTGTVLKFIPGQNETEALVVELDSPVFFKGITGNTLVLELRYVDARWEKRNIVHVELCDFDPEPKTWKDRKQGKWIESHAMCERL